MDLTNEITICLNSSNGDCKELSVKECRGINNLSYICTNLIDGWCIDETTKSCLNPIPNNFCRDKNSNICKDIILDKNLCASTANTN